MFSKLAEFFSVAGPVKRSVFLLFFLVALLLWLGAAYVDEAYLAPNLCHINADWTCYLPGEVREGVTLDRFVFAIICLPLVVLCVRRLRAHEKPGIMAALVLPLILALYAFLYLPEFRLSLAELLLAFAVALPVLWFAIKREPKKEKGAQGNVT